MNRYLIIITAVLAISLLLAFKRCSTLVNDHARLQENQTALLTEVDYYKTKSGKNAASVQVLTLKVGELLTLMSKEAAVIESLRIKTKRVESVSHTGTHASVDFTAPLRDTVIVHDTILENAQAFTWRDPWVLVSGLIRRDSTECSVEISDTLSQVVHRIPRKFLFFRYGTKGLRQEIILANPHTKITYSKYIKLAK